MRKWAFVFVASVNTLICASFAFGQDKPVSVETIERIKSAAIPIVCGIPTKEDMFQVFHVFGSGFFVNDEGYFVTAGHVVKGYDAAMAPGGKCFPAVYLLVGGWKTIKAQTHWFRFDSCIIDDDVDIAVCKTTVSPFLAANVKAQLRFVTFGSALNLRDGTPLAFTGFPLQVLRPMTSKGNLATILEADRRIVIDKDAWKGASGSPVYLSDGRVAGILIQKGIGEGEGLAFARAAEVITQFLTKNKIRYKQHKQERQQPKLDP
jgi:S1-C subfamily serine protease